MHYLNDLSKIISVIGKWRDKTFPPSKNTFDWKINEAITDINSHAKVHESFLKDILLNTTPIISQHCGITRSFDISVKSRFPLFNPSVIKIPSGYLFSLRESNFFVKADNATYQSNEDRITNYLIAEFDNSVKLVRSNILDLSPILNVANLAPNGIEDIRLFNWNEEIYGIGAAVNNNSSNGTVVRQVLFKIDSSTISNFYVLPSPSNINIEKNWSPLVRNGDLFLVYSLMPLVIFQFISGRLTYYKGNINEMKIFEMRGGTPFIPLNDYFISVSHLSTFSIRNKRYGRHLFVALDQELDIKSISEPFFISRKGIEYACGLQQCNDKIYLSYGVGDCRSAISIFDETEIYNFINL